MREALAMRSRLEYVSPQLAMGAQVLALLLVDCESVKEALSHAEEGLTDFKKLYQGDHPLVAGALPIYAYCLDADGQYEEAVSYYRDAANMGNRLKRKDDPSVWQNTVCINRVETESVADKRGIVIGDVVTSYDHQRILDVRQLIGLINRTAVSGKSHVDLEILRGGKFKRFEVPSGKLGVELGYHWLTRQEAGDAVEKYGDEIK